MRSRPSDDTILSSVTFVYRGGRDPRMVEIGGLGDEPGTALRVAADDGVARSRREQVRRCVWQPMRALRMAAGQNMYGVACVSQ